MGGIGLITGALADGTVNWYVKITWTPAITG